jgi:outer membrane lipoprotein SlyB
MRRLLALSAAVAVLTGCATTSQTQWTPTVDTYGSSRAQFLTRDTEECRALAMRASGSTREQAAQSAAFRGLVGAATGAAVGAVVDRDNWRGARRGAAIGGAAGALSGGYGAASQTDAAFRRAFNNCMRQRGHTVIN